MLRPCLSCGEVIERGSYCSACDPESQRKRQTAGRRAPAAFRAKVLKRDGGRCRALLHDGTRCPVDDPGGLQAHHLKPLGLGGSNVAANGITLCTHHHRLAERDAWFGK